MQQLLLLFEAGILLSKTIKTHCPDSDHSLVQTVNSAVSYIHLHLIIRLKFSEKKSYLPIRTLC